MKTTIRAATAVTLLAGFYVFAVGLVVALGWATVLLFQASGGPLAGKLGFLTLGVGAGVAVAFWKVLRAKPGAPAGAPLSPLDAPELWETARELATAVGTRPPDEIRLVPDVNAAVSESGRLLGLVAGRRTMYLGLPLLQAFTVAQLRSVLAHELGHYSGRHTRVGALAHRGRMAIAQTIQQLGPSSLAGRAFRVYGTLYMLVTQAVSRRMEYEADEFSVRVAGRDAAMTALRDIPIVAKAWDFYVASYVTIGWAANLAPRDVFGGFGILLRHRADEIARMRTGAPPAARSRWDSHPPIADRIAAMGGMADPAPAVDNRPAVAVLADPARLAERLQREALAVEGRTLLPWDELTDAGLAAGAQERADVLFRAAGRLSGAPTGDLSAVLDLVARGEVAALARATDPHLTADDALAALAGRLGAAIGLAARSSGRGSWRHSWSGPATFVGPEGEEMDLPAWAADALDPASTGEVRARLAAMGVDAGAARQEAATASATSGDLRGALANMKHGDQHVDVFVLDNGLLLAPAPKKTDNGRRRLVSRLRSSTLAELAAEGRFIAFEEIREAETVKRVPVRVVVTLHSGETVALQQPWTAEVLTKGDDEVLHSALAPFVVQPA